MSRLEDAEVFVAVVDAGGFTPAALALGVSQPAVSRRIAALEARLGVRLLTRSTRRLRPTDAGASFYEHARSALGILEAGECEAAAANADLRGALRVTAPPAFGRHVIVPAVAAFTAAHPAISIDLVLAERRLDLAEERIDLAVRIDDPGRASELIHTRLGDFGVVTCAAPAYLAAHGTPRTPADLARHACLLQAGPSRSEVWSFTPPARATRRSETATVKVAGPPVGAPYAALTLSPEWRGPLPAIDCLPEVAECRGCDRSPIDLGQPGAVERLVAYVWPDHPERVQRLEAAIAVARTVPPAVDAADAGEWLDGQLTHPASGMATVVAHTIVWQYFSRPTAERARRAIEAAGARATAERPVAWLAFEHRRSDAPPELTLTVWPAGGRRTLARAHPHGAWIEWEAPAV